MVEGHYSDGASGGFHQALAFGVIDTDHFVIVVKVSDATWVVVKLEALAVEREFAYQRAPVVNLDDALVGLAIGRTNSVRGRIGVVVGLLVHRRQIVDWGVNDSACGSEMRRGTGRSGVRQL